MEHELLGTISYFCSKRKMADARIETLEVHFMVNLSLTLHSTPSFKNKTRKQNGMSTLKSSAALLRVKPASPILREWHQRVQLTLSAWLVLRLRYPQVVRAVMHSISTPLPPK